MHKILLLMAASAGLALCPGAIAQTDPPRISTEAFASPPAFALPKLSPDGNKVLARMSVNGGTALAIADLAGNGLETLGLPTKSELVRYSWAGNGRIIFVMGQTLPWFGRGDRYITRAFAYDLASGKTVPLGPKVMAEQGADILWIDPAGRSILLAAQPDQFSYPSVYRVDLESGKSKLEQGPYDNIWDWYADKDGIVRFGYGYRLDTWFTYYRKSAKDGYSQSPDIPYGKGNVAGLFGMLPGSDDGYALADKNGRDALYHYNFSTRALGALVYANETNDVDGADFDDVTGIPISASYTDDRDRLFWLDPARKAAQANLEKTFGGRAVFTQSRSRDGKRAIVWVGSSTDPGGYYLVETATGTIRRLAKIADNVDRAGLSETKYVRYTARDGTEIPAYLTLPKGHDPKSLPLIIVPHGGPYGVRDSLDYDREVQFLANRGYAVLQPNYRGSSGYGTAFADKGDGQWGRAMQDDIDDGMDWLVKQGVADAKRVCIVGASYGGYVALWGATRNPERYRCAVSFAGVSDLKSQLDYSNDFFAPMGSQRRNWKNKVRGDKKFDLLSISPINKIASLRAPIMLVHGDADTRVPPKQTTVYDKALTAAGKVHETYIYPGAGHGFDKAADEKSYLDRLEAFLTKYNPS